MPSLPNPLYISLILSLIGMVFLYISFIEPWISNKGNTEVLKGMNYYGGLSYYEKDLKIEDYVLKNYVYFVGSGVYFEETEEKNYKFKKGSLEFICVIVALQFVLSFTVLFYTFLLIRRKAHLLKEAERVLSYSFFTYIGLAVACIIPFIATIIGISAAMSSGYADETSQSKWKRGVSSGFVCHLIGTILELVACIVGIVLSKLCKPKEESVYDAF